MAISFEKIFIVAGFLLILLAVQLFFKLRANGEDFRRKKSSQISLKSRLNLSNKERVDLLEVDGKSILIVFARNAHNNFQVRFGSYNAERQCSRPLLLALQRLGRENLTQVRYLNTTIDLQHLVTVFHSALGGLDICSSLLASPSSLWQVRQKTAHRLQ